MGLFDFLSKPDINQGVEDFLKASDAVLLDVRTPEEYKEGHIPGSLNIPLQTIDKVESVVENIDAPLYVYCHSGARSSRAASRLHEIGYTNVNNIGGIAAYTGEVEKIT